MTKFINVKTTNQKNYSINVDHIKLVSYLSDGQKIYQTEGQGYAKYKKEDAYVARQIFIKK